MKSFHVLTALCLVAASGCADDSDLSVQLKATPFRHIPGVELGMTGKQLHLLRPAAKYAPYLGLQERIQNFIVSYQFPTSMSDSKAADVSPDDQLQGVFITEQFDSIDKAESLWKDKIREISSTRHAPGICESFPTGGKQARWFYGTMTFAVGVFPKEPMAPNVGDRVIYAVSPTETMKQPAGATKVACPTS
jgi:hypothetical protein